MAPGHRPLLRRPGSVVVTQAKGKERDPTAGVVDVLGPSRRDRKNVGLPPENSRSQLAARTGTDDGPMPWKPASCRGVALVTSGSRRARASPPVGIAIPAGGLLVFRAPRNGR